MKPSTLLLVALITLSFVSVKSRQPSGFIPMWSSNGSDSVEVMLMNANNIIFIEPITQPFSLSQDEEHTDPYILVRFVDGSSIQVFEDYEEFKKRMAGALK